MGLGVVFGYVCFVGDCGRIGLFPVVFRGPRLFLVSSKERYVYGRMRRF